MPSQFKGVVNIDVRDSVPDWTPFREQPPPDGAPNVLLVLYDDTGLAAWSPYGGRINMPTLQKLADNGLTYTQWHTTALCSPTRSCLLTGRNHHQNGFAQIAEGAQGFPGHTGHIPMENATIGEVLRENGYNTFWVGKNHNVPLDEWAVGATRRNWPLARGFDRYYGFIGGETNNWFPTLVEDNHYVDQPYLPDEGYHLSKDLADKAISYIADSKTSAPKKPWYLWFCPGANHAPHHAPQEYIAKYAGQFDDGYEAYREWVLPRMVERGILPEGTELTDINPLPGEAAMANDHVKPWDSLSDDEKRLFARFAEVYAGFSEYTDAQVGRIIDYLEETGQLDNTIVMYAADNGASGEGTPDGSVNENKYFNAYPEDPEQNLSMLDQIGSPDTYNHYPTGWATAFSTPFKMFKRYTYQGGVADPLVISWPKGIAARGEVRNQYHHAVDIVPTILECIGLDFPDQVQGYAQTELPGVSMKYSFDADGPTQKVVQYYEMMGTRALWQQGWHVVAQRAPQQGGTAADLLNDTWELYHTEEDRAEAHDLASEHPDKVKELVNLWYVEAGKYDVLPIDNRSLADLVRTMPVADIPEGGVYRYYPNTSPVPEFTAAEIRGRSFKILARVDVTDADAEGVLIANGARFGGHSLFIKDRKLCYVYNFLGLPPEQKLASPDELAPGEHVLGVEFSKEGHGDRGEAVGTATLYVNDLAVAKGEWKTQPGHFALCGEGLTVGRDSADPVSKEYGSPFGFTGGRIRFVEINVGDDQYLDLERDFHAGMAKGTELVREGVDQSALTIARDSMVFVPGGVDTIGCAGYYPEEMPVREVEVAGVWFDLHPVTNAEFARFVADTDYVTVPEKELDAADFPGADPELLVPGSQVFTQTRGPVHLGDWTQWWRWQPGADWRHPDGPASSWSEIPDHPVAHVGWEDAQAYAAWSGRSLPTEVEWEHAARGGLAGADYAWGDELSPGGAVLANTWQGPFPWRSEDPDGHHRTSPICSYAPNGYGLYDMIGNVWEWTATPWTPSHAELPEPQRSSPPMPCCGGSMREQPQLKETDRMVMKGGSHLCSPYYCRRYRPAARQGHGIRDTTSHLGFRCVVRV